MGGEEAVLEVVDAQLGGFRVGHRTEVAGDFQAALVRFVDRRTLAARADLHVGLELRRPLARPVGHLPPSLVRPHQ